MPFRDAEFRAVMSNSIVHHIPEPREVFAEMRRVAAGLVFVRDLARPTNEAEVDRLVDLYGGKAPPRTPDGDRDSCDHQRMLFRDSLRAALTVDEVRAIASDAGMTGFDVRLTSDRHWTLTYEKA
jgi:ubiquinone/menaquinone biosynthesis C-methylase UbiE